MPIEHLNRREPLQGQKGFFLAVGVTIVEVMVFLAVVTVVASLAVPSYQAHQERKQLAGLAEQLAAFLNHAHVESVMRGQALTLSYHQADADNWCVGLREGSEACDCRQTIANASDHCTVDSAARIFAQHELSQPAILDAILGDGSISFDPLTGALVDPSDRIEFSLLSNAGQFALSVQVEGNGRVRICSDRSALQTPGFDLC